MIIRRLGTDWNISTIRIRIISIFPPKISGLTGATHIPAVTETTIVAKPTRRDTRLPYKARVKESCVPARRFQTSAPAGIYHFIHNVQVVGGWGRKRSHERPSDDHAEDHQADRRDLVFSQGLFHMMEEASVIAPRKFPLFSRSIFEKSSAFRAA